MDDTLLNSGEESLQSAQKLHKRTKPARVQESEPKENTIFLPRHPWEPHPWVLMVQSFHFYLNC